MISGLAGNKRLELRPGAWGHAAEWSGIAFGAAYAGASFGPTWPVVLTAAGAALVFAVCGGLFAESASMGVWAGCWGVLGTVWLAALRWLSYSPWHVPAFAGLAVPGVLLIPVGAYLMSADAGYLAQLRDRHAEETAAKRLRWYAKRLDGAGFPGVEALEEELAGAVRRVELRLSRKGKVKVDSLAAGKGDIERALRVRRDAIRFEFHPDDASRATMFIVETPVLTEDLPMPDLPPVLSVSDPQPVGQLESRQSFEVLFRERGLAIFGVSGAGKSNLLNVLIAIFSRCEDVILWVIDMKGGRLAAPWISPWVEGLAERPAIDWVATTRAEAETMLRAAERWMDGRTAAGAGRGSKLIPSRAEPQLVILLDEGADLTGRSLDRPEGMSNAQFAELIGRLARKQRSEAIMFGGAWQRGIATHLTSDIKSQLHINMALPVKDLAEARSVLPDDAYAQRLLVGLPIGSVLVRLPETRKPLPVKAYRLDPGDDTPHGPDDLAKLRRFAVEAAPCRPEPEAAGLAAMGEAWTRRWERSALYAHLGGGGRDVQVVPAPRGPVLPADVDAAFAAITGGLTLEAPPEADWAGKVNPARVLMYELLAVRPHHGMSVVELVAAIKKAGLDVSKGTIYRWFRDEDIPAGKVVQVGEGGKARYKLGRPG